MLLTILVVVGLTAFTSLTPQANAALAPPQQVFQATAIWGSPQSPLLVAPGSTGVPLYVEVTNLGPSTVYSLTIQLDTSYPLSPVRGAPRNLTLRLPALPAGGAATLFGYFNVSPNAETGVYNETISLEYFAGNQTETQTISVGVPILGEPVIRLAGFTYNPIRIYPGYPYVELTAVLVNTGTATASSVSVELNTSYPVYPAYNGSLERQLGYLPVGTPVDLSFPLALYNTSSTVNTTLTLTVTYNGGRTQTFSLPFTEYPKAIINVVGVYTPTVRVGDNAVYVTLTVKNTGGSPAQLLTFTLLPSDVFQVSVPSSENPLLALSAVNVTVGSLMPGQETNVTYIVEVNPNIQHGVYPLNILASWRQPGSTQPFIQTLTVPIQVHRTLIQSFIHGVTDINSDPVVVFETILLVVLIVVLIAIAASFGRRPKKT